MNIEALRRRKKELKMTFEELSARSDVSISALKDIFRGDTPHPRIDTLQAIEKALGISSEEKEKKPVAVSYEPSEKEKRLLRAFSALIPSLQDYLIETAEKLVQASSSGSGGNALPSKSKRA